MFVVSLNYIVSLDRIDAHLEEHVAFLDRHFRAGHFLMSGRKNPRTGGVIIATVGDRAVLDRILDEDPFRALGLAEYVLEEFLPTRYQDGLDAWVGPGS